MAQTSKPLINTIDQGYFDMNKAKKENPTMNSEQFDQACQMARNQKKMGIRSSIMDNGNVMFGVARANGDYYLAGQIKATYEIIKNKCPEAF